MNALPVAHLRASPQEQAGGKGVGDFERATLEALLGGVLLC